MTRFVFFLLAVCSLCSATMNIVYLNQTADGEGAVCNDGSSGIYYFKAGSKTNSTKWNLHFMGGGFCMNELECYGRTLSFIGSSLPWNATFNWGGPLSEDPSYNPHFHDWNHVFFVYCDSGSFSGDKEEPIVVHSKNIYFRGHRILLAVIKDLLKTKGLDKATDVLVSGDSAGAMTTYFHVEEIRSMMPATVKRFKAAPLSGVFLDRPNVEGTYFVGPQLKRAIFDMQEGIVNEKCQATYTGNESYKCLFAEYNLDFIETPLFVVNSENDDFALKCIPMGAPQTDITYSAFGNCSALPGWEDCDAEGQMICNSSQWEKLEEYIDAFRSIFENSTKLNQDGNGLFEYSCFPHNRESYELWDRVAVENTLLCDAVAKWFFSDNEPSSKHFYKDCHNTQTTACNPTCFEQYSSESSLTSSVASSVTSSAPKSESPAAFVYPMISVVATGFFATLFTLFF